MTRINNKIDQEYDFIIVGQGIAGTCLAEELLRRNKRILVYDDSSLPSASGVAGGLFNPVTGKNMVLTWKAATLFDTLHEFYRQMEDKLGVKLLYEMPLFRPFVRLEDQTTWLVKAKQAAFADFVDYVTIVPYQPEFVNNDFGGVMFKRTGYVDVNKLLTRFRELLQERNILRNERFFYEKLNFNGEKIVYNENSARKIIFCDGAHGFGNRLLEKIRFHRVKGEVLQLQMNYRSDFIVNQNGFVLPRNGQFRAGSNYAHNDYSWEPTSSARDEIIGKIKNMVKVDFEVLGQTAGLRPATHDRKPVIGLLPDNPLVGIFNGLGAKGVSLAPYFAKQLTNSLLNGGELDKEVNISRYFN